MVDWRERAACLDEDPELFFPDGVTPRYARQIAAAVDVCRSCAVAEDCLEFALDQQLNTGIWAGTTPDQRKVLSRRRQRPVAARAS